MLALSLGTVAALVQMWIDIEQEKDAVEIAADEFLVSIAPSAATAAYNFDDLGAQQVVAGLFTQRAISSVTIWNEGTVMIARTRAVPRTLPPLAGVTGADLISLRHDLLSPPGTVPRQPIGTIEIVVDRSAVPPAIVNRLFSYFLLSTIKNFVLGILLIAIVYGALGRHIVALSESAARWQPEQGPLVLPSTPAFLQRTELDQLGVRVRQLATTAALALRDTQAQRDAAKRSNDELSQRSDELTQAVEDRTVELRRANDKLTRLAERDELTGLRNRRAFDRLGEVAWREADADDQPLYVFLVDVDHFKAFNDYYGHQRGDDALVEVARALTQAARESGAVVARYGGEEFVAVAKPCDRERALAIAQAIHDEVAKADIAHQRSGVAEHVTVSIGCAGIDRGDAGRRQRFDALLRDADEALYEAKRQGRNRSEMFTKDIRKRVQAERRAGSRLADAVSERAFEPFFQPQVDARTGEVIGAEALARWRGPNGRIAAPSQFMETAVDAGLLGMIDAIILDKLTAFLLDAREGGLSLPRLSLNIPAAALQDEEYCAALLELREKTATPLALELLETAVMDNPADTLGWQIDRLRSAGFEIEIDDFGTGHTSILALMTLRPDRLKIARELVMPLATDPDQTRVLKSVIDIGAALGVETLAEGVETAEICDTLIRLGCPLQQGFLFGRPMAAQAFTEWLSQAQAGRPAFASG